MSAHFWGNIEVDTSKRRGFPLSVACYERELDILNFYLKCNEESPFSFSFKMGSHYAEEYTYAIDMLDALLVQSIRWLKAEFFIDAAELQRLHRVKGHIPLLQSLVFAQIDRSSDWELLSVPIDPRFARFADAFEDSPSLTHLELHMSNIKAWKCDWSSIVALRLASLSNADSLISALSQAVRLEELKFDLQNGSDSELTNISGSMITLPSLKKLTLPWNDLDLLGVLTAPGLEDLSIQFRDSDEHAGIVAAFLRRSSCSLGHLRLLGTSPAVAAEILSVTPSLLRLEIYHRGEILDQIIKLFNRNLSKGALLIGPRLKSLELRFRGDLNVKKGEIVELSTAMIASKARNRKVEGLQELTLWAHESWREVDIATLRCQCKEQDVKLTVGWSWP